MRKDNIGDRILELEIEGFAIKAEACKIRNPQEVTNLYQNINQLRTGEKVVRIKVYYSGYLFYTLFPYVYANNNALRICLYGTASCLSSGEDVDFKLVILKDGTIVTHIKECEYTKIE